MTSEAGTGTGITSATKTLTYDLAGRLTSWTHPGGTVAATYDDRGLLRSTAGVASQASSFTYDAAGRMTRRTDPASTHSADPGWRRGSGYSSGFAPSRACRS